MVSKEFVFIIQQSMIKESNATTC